MANQEINDVEGVKLFNQKYLALESEISKVIVGQKEVVRNVLIAIFSNGHVLLVGVPGLAKTLLVNSISQALGLSFNRIQFTPDLMPGDIIGSEILDENRKFSFIKGPVFTHVLLADEINRTPPKTQAALLESMQEKRVTYSGKTYSLPLPFFVLATQNPIEQEGTYPLPEAQLDRFMFNVWVDYPSFEEEIAVVKQTTSLKESLINPILSESEILYFQQLIKRIPVSDPVFEYAVKLVASTRKTSPFAHELTKKYLTWGAGPRASQYLISGAKCHAALNGKFSADIEDVKAVAVSVLRHRIMRNYHADADGISVESIIKQLM